MAAPIFQRTIVDSNGNVEIGASVEVRNEADNMLAPIYTDRELTVAKANPFVTDETGLAKFFVARGEYKVTATSNESVIVWRYVQMLDTEFVASTDTEQTLTNKTISADNNTISGIAASSFVLSNASGNIDGAAAQKAIPSGIVVGTTDTQTLTNKTLTSPSITTPTGIVKGDVGLGNVDNTADSVKNVATAAALTTARTIGGVSFDGTANINLPGVNIAGNQDTSGNAATATNVAYSGLTGTVPTWNQNTTGNAATATALQTARTIGGVSFDGTSNINLPGVNTTGNQNTTGTAANVTDTVAVANGGTGRTSLTTGNVVLGAGTSAVNFVAPGTAGNVLTSNGSTWVSSASGGVIVASTAEAQAWVNNTNVITPLRLSDAFKGANMSLAGTGYQRLPSGVIIQWGTVTLGANTRISLNYPIAFPNSGSSVTSGSDWSSAGGGGWAPCGACPNNTTSLIIWNTDDATRQVWYMAVGY